MGPESPPTCCSGQREMCAWPEPYPRRRSVIVRAEDGERVEFHSSRRSRQRNREASSSPSVTSTVPNYEGVPVSDGPPPPPDHWHVPYGYSISSASPWLPSHHESICNDQQESSRHHQYHCTETMREQAHEGPIPAAVIGTHIQQQFLPNYPLDTRRFHGNIPRSTPPASDLATSDYPRVRKTTVIPTTSTASSGGVIQQLVYQNQLPAQHSTTRQSVLQQNSSSSSYDGRCRVEPVMHGHIPDLSSSAIFHPAVLHQPDSDGDLPLHIAVAKENEQEVAHLIHMMSTSQHTSSLDIYNKLKQTPLHVAIMTSHLGIVRRLIVAGSSPAMPDRHGNTAIHLAVRVASIDCINVLLSSPLSTMAIHQQNYNGFTPLHLAVFRRDVDLIEILISRGADCNTTDGTSGRTPLFHAVRNGYEDVVRKLISIGASVNMANYAGVTPLVVATDRRLKEITSLLISRGATINARDDTSTN